MENSITIESMSNPEISYVIEKLQNGLFKCSCKSYFYSSQKNPEFICKHIEILTKSELKFLESGFQ